LIAGSSSVIWVRSIKACVAGVIKGFDLSFIASSGVWLNAESLSGIWACSATASFTSILSCDDLVTTAEWSLCVNAASLFGSWDRESETIIAGIQVGNNLVIITFFLIFGAVIFWDAPFSS
jgi:hypothetical protein